MGGCNKTFLRGEGGGRGEAKTHKQSRRMRRAHSSSQRGPQQALRRQVGGGGEGRDKGGHLQRQIVAAV